MLVLSRKHGEEIVIGEGDKAIRVVVLLGRGNRIKLGIDAPQETLIIRGPRKSLDTPNAEG